MTAGLVVRYRSSVNTKQTHYLLTVHYDHRFGRVPACSGDFCLVRSFLLQPITSVRSRPLSYNFNNKFRVQLTKSCEISGLHGGEDSSRGLLGCDVV